MPRNLRLVALLAASVGLLVLIQWSATVGAYIFRIAPTYPVTQYKSVDECLSLPIRRNLGKETEESDKLECYKCCVDFLMISHFPILKKDHCVCKKYAVRTGFGGSSGGDDSGPGAGTLLAFGFAGAGG